MEELSWHKYYTFFYKIYYVDAAQASLLHYELDLSKENKPPADVCSFHVPEKLVIYSDNDLCLEWSKWHKTHVNKG